MDLKFSLMAAKRKKSGRRVAVVRLINAIISSNKIINIQAEGVPEVIAGLGQLIGDVQVVLIEGQSPNYINHHSLIPPAEQLQSVDLANPYALSSLNVELNIYNFITERLLFSTVNKPAWRMAA